MIVLNLKKELQNEQKARNAFYMKYFGLKNRCENQNNKDYWHYGAKGVKCEWRTFWDFGEDMYESYLIHKEKYGAKNTTIERIDVGGNYCKENCRWATLSEQQRNKSNTRIITFKGKTKSLPEWADFIGIGRNQLHTRFIRGWSIEKALTKNILC